MSCKDYSWIFLPNTDSAWQVGIEKFIEHTFEGTYVEEIIACPCGMCRSMAYRTKDEVEDHVICRWFYEDFIKKQNNSCC
jgi:hypothetical protein